MAEKVLIKNTINGRTYSFLFLALVQKRKRFALMLLKALITFFIGTLSKAIQTSLALLNTLLLAKVKQVIRLHLAFIRNLASMKLR